MITESNYQKLYYVEVDTWKGLRYLDGNRNLSDNPLEVQVFAMREDAERWGKRAGYSDFEVKDLEFNFRLQYQDGPIWQHQRFYRTLEAAEAGWQSYLEKIPATSLSDRVWQLVDLVKEEVITSYQPPPKTPS